LWWVHSPHLVCFYVGCRCKGLDHLCCNLCLALPHMRPPEEELPVEVAGLNGVKVDLLQQKPASELTCRNIKRSTCCVQSVLVGRGCIALFYKSNSDTDMTFCCLSFLSVLQLLESSAHHFDAVKPRQHKGLQQLASNATSTDCKHPGCLDLQTTTGQLL